jgi:hypothetical protein
MTERELIRASLAIIAEYRRTVPPKERFKRMVTDGLIDEDGEVLLDDDKERRQEEGETV